MSTEEATVNPDGSTTFETPPVEETAGEGFEAPPMGDEEEMMEEVVKGIDPAFYLLGAVILFAIIYFILAMRKKKDADNGDDFFASLDTEKFNLKLPSEVTDYYKIKEKCEEAGWEPGSKPASAQQAANGPHRILAQALMKRAIADIPILQHVQKESPGMNKLYSQSMCSEKQWRAFQNAEGLVSSEVDEVRREAEQIEPGWSQMIWRQAMQYHGMLKQRHEQEAKAAEEAAAKKLGGAPKKPKVPKTPEELVKEKEKAAEEAAKELLKAEEQEQKGKAGDGGGGTKMKKGFLEKGKKK